MHLCTGFSVAGSTITEQAGDHIHLSADRAVVGDLLTPLLTETLISKRIDLVRFDTEDGGWETNHFCPFN